MWSIKSFKINRLIKKLSAMQRNRVHNQPTDDMLKTEIVGYQELASMYQSLCGNKKYPFARELSLECYRAAAALEDADAQYWLGKQVLDEAKMRQKLQENGLFASPSNERRMQIDFEEAHAYLSAAEKLHHIQAKRLHGLCYINGWGVEADKKKGFELVMASIDQENSWDKVPQIFASIGLNKPEFFSELTQFRNTVDKKS
jgi:TPR repeat protein